MHLFFLQEYSKKSLASNSNKHITVRSHLYKSQNAHTRRFVSLRLFSFIARFTLCIRLCTSYLYVCIYYTLVSLSRFIQCELLVYAAQHQKHFDLKALLDKNFGNLRENNIVLSTSIRTLRKAFCLYWKIVMRYAVWAKIRRHCA